MQCNGATKGPKPGTNGYKNSAAIKDYRYNVLLCLTAYRIAMQRELFQSTFKLSHQEKIVTTIKLLHFN